MFLQHKTFKSRIAVAAIGSAAMVASSFVPAVFAHSGQAPVNEGETRMMVMTHFCRPDIQSESDFRAVEALGNGNDVAALAQTVLACPTTRNPGDAAATGSVAAMNTNFAYSIRDGENEIHNWDEGEFMQHKLCESDINLDANGDGVISPAVCLDISHYEFDVKDGNVQVSEFAPPTGTRFGTLRFTPPELDNNNDKDSLRSINRRKGLMRFKTTRDNDNMIMLHVYNFQNDEGDTGSDSDSNNGRRNVRQNARIRSNADTNVDVQVDADSKSTVNVNQNN